MSASPRYPLGHSVNGSPHSVVVSLPTMADVVGYEEKDPRVLAALRSGYPRFFEHAFIADLKKRWQAAGLLPAGAAFLLADMASVSRVVDYVGRPPLAHGVRGGIGWVVYPEHDASACRRARAFLQHTGSAPSSRQAEDRLVAEGARGAVFGEPAVAMTEAGVAARLAPAFGVAPEDLVLAQGGMNAFHALFATARRLLRPTGRRRWVQLGWLYVDTIKVLQTMAEPGAEPVVWNDVFDLDGLAEHLRPLATEIAGIVTEVPTNPLIQTPDVAALRALADELGCLLILDPSIASMGNVAVEAAADVVVSSLTKYTARSGDVLLGAAAVHPERPWASALREGLRAHRVPPYERDLARFASQLEGWEAFAARTGATCAEVAAFLEGHPQVDQVWWAGQRSSADAFAQVARDGRRPCWGAVLSFSLRRPVAAFYDRVDIVKGPSFGTEFTIMCPFMYLAHYDLVRTPEGRVQIRAAGLSSELIRLSVGAEPAAEIIAKLADALEGA